MESEGIHRVRVPGTKFTAFMIFAMMAELLAQWPALRWLVLVSVSVGLLAGAGLLTRRRSRGAPPAARLNFPPPDRG